MAVRKRSKKDMRSSIIVQLPAAHADFIVELLSRELDDCRRECCERRSSVIMEILKPFRHAIELEERQRSMRGQMGRIKAEKTGSDRKNGGQDT